MPGPIDAILKENDLAYDVFFNIEKSDLFSNKAYVHGHFCLQKSVDRQSPKIFVFMRASFCYRCLNWGWNRGFKSKKSTHYLLDYGEYCENTNKKLSIKTDAAQNINIIRIS